MVYDNHIAKWYTFRIAAGIAVLALILIVSVAVASSSVALPELSKIAPYSDMPDQGTANWGSTDREFLQAGHNDRIRQNGTIYQIRFAVADVSKLTQFNFTVWRQNGSNFDRISTTNNLIGQISNGINIINLSTPIEGVQEGDFYGYRVRASGNALYVNNSDINHLTYYKPGGATSFTNYDWKGFPLSNIFVIESYMEKPYMVFIGNSIISGYPAHRSFISEQDITDISTTIENHWGIKVNRSYQNMGHDGHKTSQINNRFVSDVVNLSPEFVLIEGGINDINANPVIDNATILSNWESMIQKAHYNNITPVIMLILPDSRTSDTYASRITYINQELMKMAARYSPSIVVDARCYIGVKRPSGPAGNCWDINPSYTTDGQHYNSAGNERIAQAIKDSFSITVVSPDGGENWARGLTQTIRWNYAGSPGSYVKVELLKNGVLNSIISSSTPAGSNGSGSYDWLINSTQTPGADYKVRITSTTDSAYTDTSNNNFTIGEASVNLIKNGGFESGMNYWTFYTNGAGGCSIVSPGYERNNALKCTFGSGGTNIQLYQKDVTLEPNTRYQLSFAAYSNTGHDLSISIQKHISPYTKYGLSNYVANLGTSWSKYSVQFTTTGFSGTVTDARLMFWLAGFAAAGDNYYIDDIRLEKASASDLPTIITHPANQNTIAGQTATFSVVATGASLSYQWQKNGVNITGATGATYTTPPTALADNSSIFLVIVSNSAGNVTSNTATLTVTSSSIPPSITTQPSSQTVAMGQAATFTVTAAGTEPLSYQWQKNGVNITGATNSLYTTPAATLSDNGSTYRVNVKNNAGNVLSNSATLTVKTLINNNIIKNPGFESGTASWGFYTNAMGTFSMAPGYEGNNSARLSFTSRGTNIQLYQKDVTLEPNTRYQLSFAAYSNTGHDLSISIQKHISPYTKYGLSNYVANLGTSWSKYSVQFTTTGFSGTVTDARLMFWLAGFAAAGDNYYIDDIRLEKVQ